MASDAATAVRSGDAGVTAKGTAEAIRALQALLAEQPVRMQAVADLLDGFDHAGRVAATRSLGRAPQRRLYEAAKGFRPIRLDDIVPPATPDFRGVHHVGKNTLPAFTFFEKRFCRPRGADPQRPERLYGYNYQPTAWLRPILGPGYFVTVEDAARGEVLVDYRQVPTEHPADWPEIRSNESGLGRLVYGFMVDTLRGVSEHVSIGSAAKHGRDIGSWFTLCREP